jgi:squalene-hopene cyclase-like protein
MLRPIGVCVVALLAAGVARPAEREGVKEAVVKALPLLKKGAEGHVAHRTCFACHNQGVPMFALTAARTRGFPVADEDVKKQLEFIAKFLGTNRDEYREGKGQGGQADTAGYALLTLAAGGWKADETTEAVAEYLLLRDKDRDHWHATSNRPPSEASDFTTTAIALRALRAYATPVQKERVAKRTEAARGWLLKAEPKDTEDRVWRLWGLHAAGAKEKELRDASDQLAKAQRKDGGWSQTEALESDAYATGSALVALHQAGGLATTDPVYKRGVAFLLKTQRDDGSWLVHSRSKPFQTYFESGFPHGKDQFISMAASAWATTALADALPPSPLPLGR